MALEYAGINKSGVLLQSNGVQPDGIRFLWRCIQIPFQTVPITFGRVKATCLQNQDNCFRISRKQMQIEVHRYYEKMESLTSKDF